MSRTSASGNSIPTTEWPYRPGPSRPGLEMRFTLSEKGGTTCVRDEWKFDTGWPALLERLGMRRVKSAAAENLTKLKALLEEGWVVLQDGRQSTLQVSSILVAVLVTVGALVSVGACPL
jgi:hypothetical protein